MYETLMILAAFFGSIGGWAVWFFDEEREFLDSDLCRDAEAVFIFSDRYVKANKDGTIEVRAAGKGKRFALRGIGRLMRSDYQ